MHGLDAQRLQQQLGLQVREGAVALGCVVDLAVVGLQPGDEFAHVLGRYRGMDVEHMRAVGEQGDGFEVARDVRRGLGIEVTRNRLIGERAEEQVVAVRRRLRAGFHADHAARAGLVFHDHGLLQVGAHGLPHGAREDVGRAARRKRDKHAQRTIRKSGTLGAGGKTRAGKNGAQCDAGRAAQQLSARIGWQLSARDGRSGFNVHTSLLIIGALSQNVHAILAVKFLLWYVFAKPAPVNGLRRFVFAVSHVAQGYPDG